MALDYSNVELNSVKYPLSEDFKPSYGTAGFRGPAEKISGVIFRTGILTALRVLATRSTCGLIITASHNPPTDNGVKVVDYNGEILVEEWEKYANELSKAKDGNEIVSICEKICEKENINNIMRGEEQDVEVIVGYDTRESSPGLLKVAIEGIESMNIKISQEANMQTTPQVHLRVYRKARNLAYGEFQWIKYLAGGYMRMARGTQQKHGVLRVDCANGIGAPKLERLGNCPGAIPQGYKFDLINTGEGVLNKDCGAEYVQKQKKLPIGFNDIKEWQRCASIDGDADRVVYFTRANNKVMVFDGDRIATLLALHVKKILSMNLKFQDQYKVMNDKGILRLNLGVIQTAYANSGSTKFLKEVLEVEVKKVPTGVKHLHKAAKKYDIGIYFEPNGHGTVLFKSPLSEILRETEDHENKEPGDFELLALLDTMNQATGDAISCILAVEAILRRLKWHLEDWLKIYEEVPSVNIAIKKEGKKELKTDYDEEKVIEPIGLQDKINEAVMKIKRGRAFVRASGTEPVLRIYAEGDTDNLARELAKNVADLTNTALK